MRVFVVVDGFYSDKGTDSIWSTEELAKKRIAEMLAPPPNDGKYHYTPEDPRIEEYNLDGVPEDSRPLWCVVFDGRDGVSVKYIPPPYHYPMSGGNVFMQPDHKYQMFGNATLYIHAENGDAAIKIASERRAAAMARPWDPKTSPWVLVP